MIKTVESLCRGTVGLIVSPWKFDVLKGSIFSLEIRLSGKIFVLRTFVRKFSNIDYFLEILPLKDDELAMSEIQKNWGFTAFVLERTCPEEHLDRSKSGFVSEEGQGDCKSQNIAIRALKGNVLCQIWFMWTY